MSRWLTPVWFLGVGVTAGLAILAALIGIFYVMSKIPVFDALRESGAAHGVSAVLAVVLAARFTWYMLPTFREPNGDIARYDELVLLSIASAIFFGVFSWALMYCSSTRFMLELKSLLNQGIGLYLLSAVGVVAFVGLACTPLTENPAAAFASVPKLFVYGTTLQNFTVSGAVSEEDAPFIKMPVKYDPNTLAFLEITSNKNLLIGDGPSIAEFRSPGYRVERGVEFRWNRNMGAAKCPLPLASGADVYVQNQEFGDADIRIRIQSVPPVREATTFVLVSVFTAIFGLL
ncbi:MAG: hypothetical protein FJ308_15090, partial [Planctomycetes bacterium]|nr:hypothetical protein [Planctomycetota bacterium]